MSDYDDWNDEYQEQDDYDDEEEMQYENSPSKSNYDNYPHLFLNLGKQKFYSPFLFYIIMIVFMGLMVFNYSVA